MTWATLRVLKRSDFTHPDAVRFDVIEALDAFCTVEAVRPIILSDFRPGDPRQHGLGLAIDFAVPGGDPLLTWNKLRVARLFSGLGIYINELGAVSFHVDRRTDRTFSNPALWGGLIRSFSEQDEGELRGDTLYVTADRVLAEVKKKSGLALTVLAVLGAAWFVFRRRKRRAP